MARQKVLGRWEDGIASMVALGIILVIGVLLAGYGLWVRFAVESAIIFEQRVHAYQMAREGVGLAIRRLMEDEDPDVDWLGEEWARVDGVTTSGGALVDIRDEGSRLGLNWMDRTLWAGLPGMSPERVDEVERLRRTGEPAGGRYRDVRFFGFVSELAEVGLSEEEIAQIDEGTTTFSPFNVNEAEPDVLYSLLVSLGETQGQAATLVDQIVSIRSEQPIRSIDRWAQIMSTLRPELRRTVRPWLVFSGPINVNTASPEVLQYVLGAYDIPSERIQALIEARQQEPFSSYSQLQGVLGEQLFTPEGHRTPLGRWLNFESRFFRIVSRTAAPEVRVTVIVHRLWDAQAQQWEIGIVSWQEEGFS